MHTEALTPAAVKVLKALKEPVLAHQFVLAGGTAVALHLGHRKSVDFDFFAKRPFSTDKLFREVKSTGLEIRTLQEEKGTLTVTADGVKVSFFHSPYPFMEKNAVFIGVPVAGLIDIASMKILAITQRGAKRDFVDLYFMLQDIPFAKMARNMIERFGHSRVNPVVVGKALVYFHDAESDPEPEYLTKKKDWKTIKKFFIDHVQQFVFDLHRTKTEGDE